MARINQSGPQGEYDDKPTTEDSNGSEDGSENDASSIIDLNVDSFPDISPQKSDASSENDHQSSPPKSVMKPSSPRKEQNRVQSTPAVSTAPDSSPGARTGSGRLQRVLPFSAHQRRALTTFRTRYEHQTQPESPSAPLPQPEVSRKPNFSPTKKQKKEMRAAEREEAARRQSQIDAQLLSETRENENDEDNGDVGDRVEVVVMRSEVPDHRATSPTALRLRQEAEEYIAEQEASETHTLPNETLALPQASGRTRKSPRKRQAAHPQEEEHAEAGADNEMNDEGDRQPEDINNYFEAPDTQNPRKRGRPRKAAAQTEQIEHAPVEAAPGRAAPKRQKTATRVETRADVAPAEDTSVKPVTRRSTREVPGAQGSKESGSTNESVDDAPAKSSKQTRRSTQQGGAATKNLRSKANRLDAPPVGPVSTTVRNSELYSPDVSEENPESTTAVEQVEQRAKRKQKQASKANTSKKRPRSDEDDDEKEKENTAENPPAPEEDAAGSDDDNSVPGGPLPLYGQLPTLKKIQLAAIEITADAGSYDPIVKKVVDICKSTSAKLLQFRNHEGEYMDNESDPAVDLQELDTTVPDLWKFAGKEPKKRLSESEVKRQVYQRVIPQTVKLLKSLSICYLALDGPNIVRGHLQIVNSLIDLIIDIDHNSQKLPMPDWSKTNLTLRKVRHEIIAQLKKVNTVFNGVEKAYWQEDRLEERRAQAEQDRIINEQRREQARLEYIQRAQEANQRRQEAAKREAEEEEAAAEAAFLTRRITKKWNELHSERMVAEGGMIRPVKLEHLANHQHSAWDIDQNGDTFERIPGLITRVGPLPFMIQRAREQKWSDKEYSALCEGLKLHAGEFVFERIFHQHCRRTGILHRFSVTEIVTTAADLKTYLLLNTPPGIMPEPWIRAIPVWTGSQASLRTDTIFGVEHDVEIDVDIPEEGVRARERDQWDDMVDGVTRA